MTTSTLEREPASQMPPTRTTARSRRLVPAILFIIGVMVALYPTTAQWFEQKNQSDATEALAGTTQTLGPLGREQMRDDAIAYNEALLTGVGLSDMDYDSLVNPGGVGTMARLRIPAINLDQPIRHGMSELVLTQGLGHLENSSLPVGGESTHAVIGGHRGLATAVGFTYLDRVKVGDQFFIETLGETLTYDVVSYTVLDPGTAELQPIVPGKDLVTLITCTPIGLNTHRIVILGERHYPNPPGQEAGQPSTLPGFPWWALILGVTATVAAVYVWAPRKRDRPIEAA